MFKKLLVTIQGWFQRFRKQPVIVGEPVDPAIVFYESSEDDLDSLRNTNFNLYVTQVSDRIISIISDRVSYDTGYEYIIPSRFVDAFSHSALITYKKAFRESGYSVFFCPFSDETPVPFLKIYQTA